MPSSDRTLYGLLLGLLVGAWLLSTPVTVAQSSPDSPASDSSAAADTSAAPPPEPYATSRSVAYHVLAAPAYLLHAATRPLGWTVRYVEQEFPNLFKPRRPPRGVLPLVDLGGPTGFLAGLALYDNHLFGSSHSARLEGLYGGPDTFRGKGVYRSPTPLGPDSQFETVVNVFSDPKSVFFLNGNDSDRRADRTRFSRDQLDATVGLNAGLPGRALRGAFEVLYEHVEISGAGGDLGERLTDAAPEGIGTADLLTSRLTLGLDVTGDAPRVSRGTEVILQLDYTHALTADRFRYGRYVAEIRQYLPVGFFPDSRRLALRARLEQVEPLFEGSAVPFYQLPELGGQRTLRGFRGRRFQNDGSLLVNAEYRYPIWSNFDALVFVDAGQVFDTFAQVGIERVHWSYGGGIHLLNQKGLSFRFEVAGSTEGIRTILTVDPSSRRVAR